MNNKIPAVDFSGIHDPLEAEFLASFKKFLAGKWYVLGDEVSAFEQSYAHYIGQEFGVGLSSGMAALHLGLVSLGIGPGDEVIVPAHTYVATWLAVSYVGATPIPVEPDPLTGNISTDGIKSAITDKTKLILPVHMYGLPCDMTSILTIANQHRIPILEDNAQGHGAKIEGRLTGSFGMVNAHSFYPTKNLGAMGEAGAITTDDPDLAQRIARLRNYGADKKYINAEIGYNYRLDELQAAILNVKLKYLDSWILERRKIADRYNQHLRNLSDIALPNESPGTQHAFHQYVIRTPARDELKEYLANYNIHTLIHYPVPPHRQAAYHHLNYGKGAFPIAEKIANECLSLPLYIGISESQIHQVCAAINRFFS